MGGSVTDRFLELEPVDEAGYWMYSVMAILAILTMIQWFRKPATKFTEDDFVRAELMEDKEEKAQA